MFELKDLFGDVKVVYKYDGEEIEFIVDSLLKTRLKNTINSKTLFVVLNAYLKYKGDTFQKELLKLLLKADIGIVNNSLNADIDPMPTGVIYDILDLFSLEDIVKFLKESKIIKVPDVLEETYDGLREINDRGSREQTFLIEDYYELIALITILKAIMGPVGFFATLRKESIPVNYRDYILFNLIADHKLVESKPFVKLFDYTDKLVNIAANNSEEFSKRIIEKKVSKEEMTEYIVSIIVFQRLFFSNEVEDINSKNIITRIYNTVTSNVQLKNNSTNSVKIKKPYVGANADGEEQSVFETSRILTELPIAMPAEFNKAVLEIDRIIEFFEMEDYRDLCHEVFNSFKIRKNFRIVSESKYFTSWILDDYIGCRAINYLSTDAMKAAVSIAFTWLVSKGFSDLALLLTSEDMSSDTDVFKFNASHKNKFSPELRNKVTELYPYNTKLISKDQVVVTELMIKVINDLVKDYSKYNLVSLLDNHLLDKYNNGRNVVVLKSDIKNRLLEMLIALND